MIVTGSISLPPLGWTTPPFCLNTEQKNLLEMAASLFYIGNSFT